VAFALIGVIALGARDQPLNKAEASEWPSSNDRYPQI
jgi:hypothetical protein